MQQVIVETRTRQGDLLKVYPDGAKIEVTLRGETVLGNFTRGDGKLGITHPCTPIFGPDRKGLYGLKQHGLLRTQECQVGMKDDAILVSHVLTDPGYPVGVSVMQQMRVADGVFYFEMTHTNSGTEEAAVNVGEHCYFAAHQGFRGTTVNGQNITELIEANYDGIAIALKETNTIQIPGKPVYNLTQTGFKKAVVWVGKNPESKEPDTTYVCIEPVEEDPFGDFFGSPQSMLHPGKSRTVTFTLTF